MYGQESWLKIRREYISLAEKTQLSCQSKETITMVLCCLAVTTSTTIAYALSGQNPLPKRKPNPARKPSLFEIERAIGAGVFRDRDTSEPPQKDSVFDKVLSNTIGRSEGAVEKQLRETGEWLSENTEKASRSSNTVRSIVVFMFVWVLPGLLLSLFVATGTIKLPFSIPAIEDLIM